MQGTATTEEQSTPRNAYCPHSYDAFIRFNVPLADSMCTDMYPYLILHTNGRGYSHFSLIYF